MKKILIASTALGALTAAAAADVTLSGRAEMGLFDNSASDVQFFTDIDVTFTMTGETDNGLTFGASVDLDEGGAVSSATQDDSDDGGATIFISGSFGTVTIGDTDGALDWALTEAGNVGNAGSIADDETIHAGYLGSYLDGTQDGQILRWDNTFGDFGVAISLEDDNGSNGEIGYAVGLRYNLELGGTTIALGIGHQEGASIGPSDFSATGVSATATFDNGFSAGIVYTDFDNTPADSHLGIGIGYTTGALTLHANYGDFDAAPGFLDADGFGISAAYDLGGGAVVHFGYGDGEVGTADFQTVSLGLGLSF